MTHRRTWLSVAQAAEQIGVSDRTIRTMIADGRLTAYRNGARLIRLDQAEIDASFRPFGLAATKNSPARSTSAKKRARQGVHTTTSTAPTRGAENERQPHAR